MGATNDKKQIMLEALSKEPIAVIETAYLYARTYVNYGEDITKAWDTATQNVAILEKAYSKGYVDATIVESTRKKGKWIKHTSNMTCEDVDYFGDECWDGTTYECSICHKEHFHATNFCPNCGTEMESEE